MHITITGLRFWAHHGVLPHETSLGQEFLLDLDLDVDVDPRRDELGETLDYGTLADDVVDAVTGTTVKLIETVAQRAMDVCLRDERVREATVTVHKPSAPLRVPAAEVAVTLRRTRPALHVAGPNDRAAVGADVRTLPTRGPAPDGVA